MNWKKITSVLRWEQNTNVYQSRKLSYLFQAEMKMEKAILYEIVMLLLSWI